MYSYKLVNIVNLGSGMNQYFWEMGGNVATIAFMVFCVMMNIRSLPELQAIFGSFLAIIRLFLGV